MDYTLHNQKEMCMLTHTTKENSPLKSHLRSQMAPLRFLAQRSIFGLDMHSVGQEQLPAVCLKLFSLPTCLKQHHLHGHGTKCGLKRLNLPTLSTAL